MSIRYQKQIEHRDRLYYDAYQHSLAFHQAELYCIRGLPGGAQLDRYVKQRQYYENLSVGKHLTFTPEVVANLHQTQEFLKGTNIPFKLVVSNSYGNLYTNDPALVDRFCELSYVGIGNLRTAEVTMPRDTIVIRNPEFQYRTYFREREVSEDRKATLINWINAQQGEVRPSPATRQWLKQAPQNWRSKYMQRYYYIEHDSLQYETMLSLIVPGHVRKTVPVISSDK